MAAMPREFRQLAEWAWTELRPAIDRHVSKHGVDPIASAQIAARAARVLVRELYTDIRIARMPKIGQK